MFYDDTAKNIKKIYDTFTDYIDIGKLKLFLGIPEKNKYININKNNIDKMCDIIDDEIKNIKIIDMICKIINE